jgi:hypothetical protein
MNHFSGKRALNQELNDFGYYFMFFMRVEHFESNLRNNSGSCMYIIHSTFQKLFTNIIWNCDDKLVNLVQNLQINLVSK